MENNELISKEAQDSVRKVAESLFFEKDNKSGKLKLTAFGGLAVIVACVSMLTFVCKANKERKK